MAVLSIAVIHEVFHEDGAQARLVERLKQASGLGAELALLPELPLDPWIPATRNVRDEDAEPPGGPRHRRLSRAASTAGIGVLGGAITVDAGDGKRYNRALLYDARGELRAEYDKVHVPGEEGFWESDHYEEGAALATPVEGFALPVGLQICSDLFRPEGCHLLGANGVAAIFAPRATPAASYERWRSVIRMDAVTSCCFVASTNRPGPESGIGGASVVAAPDGRVVHESEELVSVIRLDSAEIDQARRDYPGYLSIRSELYARGWDELSRGGPAQ